MTADAVGGVWSHALTLARGLTARGAAVRLLVPGPPPDAARMADAAGLDVVPVSLDLEWRDKAGLFPDHAARLLRRAATDFAPDVVHVNGYREAAAGFAAPVLIGAHSCVRTWWRACRGGNPPADWGAYDAGVVAGLRRARVLVAPSRAFLAAFRDAWGALPETAVIPNGAASPAFSVPPPKRPVVLAAGRLWDEAKGIALLEAVAPDLPWPVRLAGDGGEGTGTVRLGRLAHGDLLDEMAGAAIFAAPARYEPFGLAVLEAAAKGCALVLSDIPGFRELWDGAARFVPPDDADGLRRGLRDVIAGDAERERLQRAALVRAGRYDAGRMAQSYLDLYRCLVAQHPREAAA